MIPAQVEIFASGAEPGTQAAFQRGEQDRQFLMDRNPEFLVSLALHDGDHALIDIAPTHDKDVGHALTCVEGKRGSFPEMGFRALAKMLNGVPRPGGPAFADLKFGNEQARVVETPAAKSTPSEQG